MWEGELGPGDPLPGDRKDMLFCAMYSSFEYLKCWASSQGTGPNFLLQRNSAAKLSWAEVCSRNSRSLTSRGWTVSIFLIEWENICIGTSAAVSPREFPHLKVAAIDRLCQFQCFTAQRQLKRSELRTELLVTLPSHRTFHLHRLSPYKIKALSSKGPKAFGLERHKRIKYDSTCPIRRCLQLQGEPHLPPTWQTVFLSLHLCSVTSMSRIWLPQIS